ncbi:terminase [Pseudothauera rhizosphaerae]|uniref:Terminase n=1 Tax=Pseudothauera rhizosphaerae TaxID=2565932 RepID=A0A4S4AWC1_9RHOO|nr:terminase [Pseudothauera rhizosphaerae]THF64332.1 terminase [Pseudothauera rhizosphaerae]
MADPDAELIELAAECSRDPLRWVGMAYDWGVGELADHPGPRAWQAEMLAEIRDHLQSPVTRFQPLMIARASGHGIGKSAAIGMVVNWALSTCEDAKVVITANTDTQLRTKTAPEVGKWQRTSITSHWLDVQATSVAAMDKDHAKAWRADFVPWSEHNTEAFAGLHNKGKRIVLIFDEASAISDKVWEVAEGALTDEDTEIIWLAFGNPTRNAGRFRECFRRFKHRWMTRQIDSRTVEGTNKEQIAKWAADYGEDSDFFKVRVRGMFPSMSARQFIGEADVSAAYGRVLRPEQYDFAPKILTCDPAWEGDDELVIGLRQGLAFRILHVMPKNDNDLVVAQKLAQFEDDEGADAVFVDAGFGTGIVSAGQGMGRSWTLVWFASASGDPGAFNKRAEMWKAARDWLKSGGAIPEDPQLRDELQAPEVVPRVDGKVQIEAKKDMKARGVPSPNRADALVLSFAFPVIKRHPPGVPQGQSSNDYDPYAALR